MNTILNVKEEFQVQQVARMFCRSVHIWGLTLFPCVKHALLIYNDQVA